MVWCIFYIDPYQKTGTQATFSKLINYYNSRPTPAVAGKHTMCVNVTWLGTTIFQLELEIHSSALGEAVKILSLNILVC